MSDTKDGGPAFPREDYQADNAPGQRGMSLRDYFGAKAMVEALRHERDLRSGMISPGDFRYDAVAHAAYVMADAMLKAREVKP